MNIFAFVAQCLLFSVGFYLVLGQSNSWGLLILVFWAGSIKQFSPIQISTVVTPALLLGLYADSKFLAPIPYMLIGLGSGFAVLAARSIWLSLFPVGD